jgi:hypothetical protein
MKALRSPVTSVAASRHSLINLNTPIFNGRLTHWGRGHLNCLNAHSRVFLNNFNPLNAELNPICYFLTLLAHHFFHVSRIRVKSLTLRLRMSYDISSVRVHQLLYCVSLKIYNKFAIYFCELKIFRKCSPKTLVVLEGEIPLETFPLVEWH